MVAVLSQPLDEKLKLHPMAYFSKELTPTETNYDVGSRELLAKKLALDSLRFETVLTLVRGHSTTIHHPH